MTSTYMPGVCNIGRPHIRRRRAVGATGIAVAAIGLAASITLHAPRSARLVLAVPASAGIAGLVQSYLGFCASLGLRGLRAGHDSSHDPTPVLHPDDRLRDRRTALRILVGSSAAGAAAAFAATLLPR